MNDCKPIELPANPNVQLSKDMAPQTIEETEYMTRVPFRSIVGSLLHLMTNTRPDIAYAVIRVCQHCANPGPEHWKADKRILRYLKGTSNVGIQMQGDPNKIVAFADSDWAGDVDDRKSTSGYLVKIGGTPIIWGSKKQTSVTRSSFAAESVALTSAIDEIQWLCAFLKNLGYKPTYVPVAVDNQSLIATMNGNKSPTRLKHIDLRFHWLKEQMEKGDFKIEYCPTDKTTADIFTKALGSILFTRHRDNLSMVSLNQPLPP